MADENFDLDDFRIVGNRPKAQRKAARSYKQTRNRGFVQRFIVATPLEWQTEAARLPGKALHVATALRYLSGLRKAASGIKMESRVLSLFGVSHQTYNRCLKSLETAGLVRVERRQGQTPIVSILDE